MFCRQLVGFYYYHAHSAQTTGCAVGELGVGQTSARRIYTNCLVSLFINAPNSRRTVWKRTSHSGPWMQDRDQSGHAHNFRSPFSFAAEQRPKRWTAAESTMFMINDSLSCKPARSSSGLTRLCPHRAGAHEFPGARYRATEDMLHTTASKTKQKRVSIGLASSSSADPETWASFGGAIYARVPWHPIVTSAPYRGNSERHYPRFHLFITPFQVLGPPRGTGCYHDIKRKVRLEPKIGLSSSTLHVSGC